MNKSDEFYKNLKKEVEDLQNEVDKENHKEEKDFWEKQRGVEKTTFYEQHCTECEITMGINKLYVKSLGDYRKDGWEGSGKCFPCYNKSENKIKTNIGE